MKCIGAPNGAKVVAVLPVVPVEDVVEVCVARSHAKMAEADGKIKGGRFATLPSSSLVRVKSLLC